MGGRPALFRTDSRARVTFRGVNRPAGGRGKHQPVIFPGGPGLKPGFQLSDPVLFEDGYDV